MADLHPSIPDDDTWRILPFDEHTITTVERPVFLLYGRTLVAVCTDVEIAKRIGDLVESHGLTVVPDTPEGITL